MNTATKRAKTESRSMAYLKLSLVLLAIFASVLGRGGSQANASPQPPQPNQRHQIEVPPLQPMPGIWIDWRQRLIHAQGTGLESPNQSSEMSYLLALRAARVDALRKLTAVVYGMHIDRQTTLDEYLQPHTEERKTVSGLIYGAREYRPAQRSADGHVTVHLVLPLNSVEKEIHLPTALPRQ